MANGVRINNLNQATSLNDTDTITIVQDNENKKASISLFDKGGTYTQSVVNTIPDLITTSKANVETTKQAIDEKFGDDKFSAQIVTSQAMSSVGVSDDGSVDVSSQVQDGFMESAILYGKTQYHDTTADVYYDSMPEDTTGMTLELVSVKMPILHTIGKNLFNPNNVVIDSSNTYGYIDFTDYDGKLTFSITDKDTSIDMSEIKFGAKENYNGTNSGWLFANGNLALSSLTTSKRKYFRFYPNNQETLDKIMSRYNIQVEIGYATPYEPFKSSNILTVDGEYGSVGDVADTVNLITGEVIQRTELRLYQQGDETNSEVITDMTNTRYKLAQEVVKTVDLNSGNGNVKTPIVYKNGHILLQSDGLIPELHYSIPVSYSGLIAQNTMTNLKHSWRLDELEIMAYTSIVNSKYESLILVATAETNEVVVSSDYVPDESLYNMLKVLVNANALENADEKINVFYLYGKLSDEMYIDLIMGDDM